MNIVEIKHVEDCFDGSCIKELVLNEPISKEFIFLLGKCGTLSYFKDFASPFFRVSFDNNFYIKGVQGNDSARLHIRDNDDINTLINYIKMKEG